MKLQLVPNIHLNTVSMIIPYQSQEVFAIFIIPSMLIWKIIHILQWVDDIFSDMSILFNISGIIISSNHL